MASEDQNMPLVKHYEQRDYNGMFDYNKEDELLLIRNIIVGKCDSVFTIQTEAIR
jgi:hypothetical protein